MYKSGFQFWFDSSEIKRVHAHNQQFEVQTVEEELLLESYRKADPSDKRALKLSATQILKNLNKGDLPNGANSGTIRLGQALHKHGFKSVTIKGVKKWIVVKIDGFHERFNGQPRQEKSERVEAP